MCKCLGWLGWVTKALLYASVSFQRIDKFIHEEEELESIQSPQNYSEVTASGILGYKNATLSWSKPGSEDDNHFRLSALNIECTPGALTVVSGPVGSGKTSFLLGLLGEMRLLEGQICLPRDQGVAYVSQTPWLQNATIKDNILFGSEYDEKRYKAVLEACALAADIGMFTIGDLTEVGERGKPSLKPILLNSWLSDLDSLFIRCYPEWRPEGSSSTCKGYILAYEDRVAG